MIIPVILAGGTGTRLWPLSRQSHPKPFLTLPDGDSLLKKTFSRACKVGQVLEVITITNQAYFVKSQPEYQDTLKLHLQPPQQTFILEPFGRNTASAIAMASLKIISSYGEDAILLVLPADHLIENENAFLIACEKAFTLAKKDHLVTFGIQPTMPETGFGYIQCGDQFAGMGSFKVKRFIEKPPIEHAIQFFESKSFFWNAGIFCFKAGTIVDEYTQHANTILQQAKDCWEKSQSNAKILGIYQLDTDSFGKMDNISFDYALLEKSERTAVVTCDFSWRDIGSWVAYKELHEQDKNGNSIVGDSILIGSQHNFIHSPNKLVAAVGLQNLIIVDTPDALLISTQERVQDVKSVVETLKKNDHKSYFSHHTEQKPWGSYTVLDETSTFKVKRIIVHAGASLSLQSHKHRCEHWIIVEGKGKIQNGKKEFIAKKNHSIYVPRGRKHRITNIGKKDLILIEVQLGSYLGEDDITRYEDNYGRQTI